MRIGRGGCTEIVSKVGSNRNYPDSLPEGHQNIKARSKPIFKSKSSVMVFGSPSRMWSRISGS
jgi:hypothetical protein